MGLPAATVPETLAAAIFAVAVIHTFSTRFFAHLAHLQPRHAGLWHLLGEVEVVFGFWAFVLVASAWSASTRAAARPPKNATSTSSCAPAPTRRSRWP